MNVDRAEDEVGEDDEQQRQQPDEHVVHARVGRAPAVRSQEAREAHAARRGNACEGLSPAYPVRTVVALGEIALRSRHAGPGCQGRVEITLGRLAVPERELDLIAARPPRRQPGQSLPGHDKPEAEIDDFELRLKQMSEMFPPKTPLEDDAF